jgi:transcriptional regulator NrdR family protein
MRCRKCNSRNTRVTSTDITKAALTKRYCRCLDCKTNYQTTETYTVVKRGSMFGVQQDNSRKARGERVSSAVLIEANVLEIRRLASNKQTYNQIAKQFGIHKDTVYKIVNRKSWAHV